MTDQKKKNQRTIIILALMTIIPFSIAWYLTKDADFRPGATNNGDLIIPLITTERSDLQGIDPFSIDNIDELKGHWVMLNIIPRKECNKVCVDAIHASKQIRLMINKDLTRTRRAVIVMQGERQASYQPWWDEDERLLKLRPTADLAVKVKALLGADMADGQLILMDPLGNLMMQYKSGFDPYAVKQDVKKLLRISQIG